MSEAGNIQLPEGWEILPVRSLGKAITGNTPPTKEADNYGGDIPFIKPTELVDRPVSFGRETISDKGAEKARILPKGSVLVSCIGNLGKTAIAKRDLAFNQQINAVVFNESVIPEYGFYYFQTAKFRKDLESLASATTISIVNKSKFESINVPIAPPEQQKRIVTKIEELFSHIDAGIEALKKAKQLLKQYRQSVLKAAVTGELTKEWREANKDKLESASQLLERILKERREKWEEQQLEKFKAKGKMPEDDKWKEKYKDLLLVSEEELKTFPKLPDGWIYTGLGNVIDKPKYGTSKKCSYDVKGIGVLRIPNVAHGVIDSEDLKYAIFDDGEVETYKLEEGDILTIRSNGSINLVGKCALINADDTKYLYAGYLIRLRPNSDVVDGSYLINALNSIQLRQQIESKAKSTSGVNNINSGELQSLVVPICSKEEQFISIKLVEEKLASSDRLLEELSIQQIKAEKNKQSILATAFSGTLAREMI
jgi:type I restriction enzyme S subunit